MRINGGIEISPGKRIVTVVLNQQRTVWANRGNRLAAVWYKTRWIKCEPYAVL